LLSQWSIVLFLFFFQAEDVIRDFHVTGVQTCALPILVLRRRLHHLVNPDADDLFALTGDGQRRVRHLVDVATDVDPARQNADSRSEESRAGKERRYTE